RLGNFINGELWGRESNLPWAMVFPHAHDNLLRHPSQLYQMLLEGIILFIILWIFSRKPRPLGQVSGLFLIGYSLFRFLAEFTREPDSFLGYLAAYFTMGQLLYIPMFAIGMYLFYRADTSRPDERQSPPPAPLQPRCSFLLLSPSWPRPVGHRHCGADRPRRRCQLTDSSGGSAQNPISLPSAERVAQRPE